MPEMFKSSITMNEGYLFIIIATVCFRKDSLALLIFLWQAFIAFWALSRFFLEGYSFAFSFPDSAFLALQASIFLEKILCRCLNFLIFRFEGRFLLMFGTTVPSERTAIAARPTSMPIPSLSLRYVGSGGLQYSTRTVIYHLPCSS